MNNLEQAILYAEKMKWRILPCNLEKVALLKDWTNKATCQADIITQWWKSNPNCSIGVACGPESGIWVLDIDLPDGPNTIKDWENNGLILPQTLTQETGSGGTQYFFKWNGKEVRNSSKKLGPGIDVRGDGGYVIVPPSGHLSGNNYKWINKTQPVSAPDWLYELIQKTKEPASNQCTSSSYGESALTQEIMKLSRATEGQRNETLNSASYSLGQLIAGGELERERVESMLLGVALGVGLKNKEANATINSGIIAGMKNPRQNPHANNSLSYDIGDRGDTYDNGDNRDNRRQYTTLGDTRRQQATTGDNENQDNSENNLFALIGEYITNSTGSFTDSQIDNEFCLRTRAEKKHRSKCLSIYKNKKLIKKDKTIKGKWYVISSQVQWVDLDQADESPFQIILPFGLHEKISIPPRSIIVVAGSTNSGKTAFILNTLRLNINQEYDKIYCMSEMGSSEYKDRVKSFGDSLNTWKANIKAAEQSYDFDGLIQHHNPNGLTCIDYLEEIDGEYFKIPSSIRDIYDSLETGVALIAIQKKTEAIVGRGGEATKDKARLYMTIDFLCSLDHGIACALRLTKVKKSLHENMQDKELHFKIERGCDLSILMDWTFSSNVNRSQCILKYSGLKHQNITPYDPCSFMTVEQIEVTLSEKDFREWENSYKGYDLRKELARVSGMSYTAAWLNKKNWYWQLGRHLDKKYKEHKELNNRR
jgi:3-dehydroquinate dehydratase